MSVRMRITKGKRNSRRSHDSAGKFTQTIEAGVLRRRHYASRTSGVYRGRMVIDMSKKQEKNNRKKENKVDETENKKIIDKASIPEERQ